MNSTRSVHMPSLEYNETVNFAGKADRRSAIRGLLYREWMTNGRRMEWFLAIWLIGLWIFPVSFHPGVVLVFGALYAWVVGVGIGGSDALEGSEEFALSLPPTRDERYWTRFLFGAIPLLAMTCAGVAGVAWNLPQRLWGLVVESGFTEPYRPPLTAWWHGVAVTGSLWLFCVCFVLASLARTQRGVMRMVWLKTGIFVAVIVVLSICKQMGLSDSVVFGGVTAFTGITAPVVTLAGHQFYRRKEAGWDGEAGENALGVGRGGSWTVAAVVGILVAGLIALLVAKVAVSGR